MQSLYPFAGREADRDVTTRFYLFSISGGQYHRARHRCVAGMRGRLVLAVVGVMVVSRGTTVFLLLVLLCGGLLPRANAASIDPHDGFITRGPVEQAQPCSWVLGIGRMQELGATISYEEENVGPEAKLGRPRLCLFYFPKEDVYAVMLTGIDNVDQFRAAKGESIGKLQARGLDLCKIAWWGPVGTSNQPGYVADEYYGLPVTCAPTVIAGDADAVTFLSTVRESVARGLSAVGADFGWQGRHPIAIIVVTNVDSAAEMYRRHRFVGATAEGAEARGRDGTSLFFSNAGPVTVYGNLALINLSDPNVRTAARIDSDVQQGLGIFAVQATASTRTPDWLLSGLGLRYRYARALNGTSGGYLVEAARAVRDNRFLKLVDITTYEQRNNIGKESAWFPLWSRDYAGTAYLYDRYGDAAVKQFLQDTRNRSRDEIVARLASLTGRDMAGLDDAVNAWLLERPRFQSASADGQIKAELLLFSDGKHGEMLVEEAVAGCVFDATTGNPNDSRPGLVGFSLTLGGDGAFNVVRPGIGIGNSATVTG